MIDPKISSVLDEQYHKRLLDDLDHLTRIAGIQQHKHLIAEPLSKNCPSKVEAKWVENYRSLLNQKSPIYGMVYFGGSVDQVTYRMMALVAALMRNYVDARIYTTSQLFSMLSEGEQVEGSVICIPNFVIPLPQKNKQLHEWKVAAMYDLLIDRMIHGQQTVVAAPDLGDIARYYSPELQMHIKSKFLEVLV